MWSPHIIVKCGSTNFDAAGRFNQIWNSSTGVRRDALREAGTSRVHDALAGRHPLHVAAAEARRAPSESLWSMNPRARGSRSRSRGGGAAETGNHVAVVHPPAVDGRRSPGRCCGPESEAAGPIRSLPPGSVVVVHAEQEGVARFPTRKDRGELYAIAQPSRHRSLLLICAYRSAEREESCPKPTSARKVNGQPSVRATRFCCRDAKGVRCGSVDSTDGSRRSRQTGRPLAIGASAGGLAAF
jgi:hypothetical protein